jgi:hypothetical protein
MSHREALADIISMAQQASPKVAGQSELLRPQSIILLTDVSRMLPPSGGSMSRGSRGVWVLETYCTGAQGLTGLTRSDFGSSSIPIGRPLCARHR